MRLLGCGSYCITSFHNAANTTPALSNLAECDESEFRKLSSDFHGKHIHRGWCHTWICWSIRFSNQFLGTNEFPISVEHIIFASILMFTSIVDQIFSGILTQKRAIKHSQICVLTTIAADFSDADGSTFWPFGSALC